MTIRADVVELLHAGLSDRAIARQLHTDGKAVSAARQALGLHQAKSGRPAKTAEQAFHAHAEPVDAGHMRWTGHLNNHGLPIVLWLKNRHSAYRVAFRIHNGRDPIGSAAPGCGMDGCVAPAHIDEASTRQRNRTAFNALFGGAA